MEEKEFNDTLTAYFSKQREVPEKGAECPPIETLGKYVSGALEPGELYNISSHVKSCKFCNEIIEGALLYSVYGKNINLGSVPDKVKNRAKSLNPAYKTKVCKIMDYLKRNIWFILFLIALVASFFFPRYFLQFLILAVIFGLKWVFNRESMRTLIMIYNTWKKHDIDSDKEMERIFKNRLF